MTDVRWKIGTYAQRESWNSLSSTHQFLMAKFVEFPHLCEKQEKGKKTLLDCRSV